MQFSTVDEKSTFPILTQKGPAPFSKILAEQKSLAFSSVQPFFQLACCEL